MNAKINITAHPGIRPKLFKALGKGSAPIPKTIEANDIIDPLRLPALIGAKYRLIHGSSS